MSESDKKPDPDAILAEMRKHSEQGATELSNRLDNIDAEYLFQTLLVQAICRNSMDKPEHEIGTLPSLIEYAAFLLYPRFGNSANREPADVQACLDLLRDQHQSDTMLESFGVNYANPELGSIQVWLRLNELGVRGEAYGSHTRELIVGIHGKFNGWYRHSLGINPERALAMLDVYEKVLNANHQASSRGVSGLFELHQQFLKLARTDFEAAVQLMKTEESVLKATGAYNALNEYSTKLPVSLDQVRAYDPSVTPEEWEALKRLVGMTRDRRRGMSHRKEVRKTPLFFLRDDRILTAELSTTYEALFMAFEAAIKADGKKRDEYDGHMSKWMEKTVAEYLRRVFPRDRVYTNLTYPEPGKVKAEAELDVAVQWGPYLLLVEVKGRQFRETSRWGEPAHLHTDLKKNVEEAFAQTQRAALYITEAEEPRFNERDTKRQLIVTKSEITTVFAVSVTLRDFKGLMTHLARLNTIGLFRGGVYPWGVSLTDLNIITTFLANPDAFVHYIKRRIEMQRADCMIAGDEIDLFSTYLVNRLDPEEVWARRDANGDPVNFLLIAPCSEEIDRWYAIEQGVREGPKPEIGLQLPRCLEIALAALSSREDEQSRYIAIKLLDLPPALLNRVDEFVTGYLSGATRSPLGRITAHHGGVPITILLGDGFPPEKAREALEQRIQIEAYRCKSAAAVGLYFDVKGRDLAFHTGMIMEKTWTQDDAMDKFIREEPAFLIPGQELPGAYDPCFCGSGKKFKFCCEPKMKIRG